VTGTGVALAVVTALAFGVLLLGWAAQGRQVRRRTPLDRRRVPDRRLVPRRAEDVLELNRRQHAAGIGDLVGLVMAGTVEVVGRDHEGRELFRLTDAGVIDALVYLPQPPRRDRPR